MSHAATELIVGGKPGRYWHLLKDGRIQCDVCPRYCKLHEEQRGLCFVRARRNDEIVLTTYGRSSGFSIDPFEKKPGRREKLDGRFVTSSPCPPSALPTSSYRVGKRRLRS